MKFSTIKRLLKEDPANLSADQIGKICLYNYFSEETDRGSIFDLDDLLHLIVNDDADKTRRVYLYIKMVASLRHMRLIAQRSTEQVLKVLECNAHAVTVIGNLIYIMTQVEKIKGLSDKGIIEAVKKKYPVMLEVVKEQGAEIASALSIVLAYNKILDIIKEYYKEDLAEELKENTQIIGDQMTALKEKADKLIPLFGDVLFIHDIKDFEPQEKYIKLAQKFVVNVENYNTFLPTGTMLRVLTEGYDRFIK